MVSVSSFIIKQCLLTNKNPAATYYSKVFLRITSTMILMNSKIRILMMKTYRFKKSSNKRDIPSRTSKAKTSLKPKRRMKRRRKQSLKHANKTKQLKEGRDVEKTTMMLPIHNTNLTVFQRVNRKIMKSSPMILEKILMVRL